MAGVDSDPTFGGEFPFRTILVEYTEYSNLTPVAFKHLHHLPSYLLHHVRTDCFGGCLAK